MALKDNPHFKGNYSRIETHRDGTSVTVVVVGTDLVLIHGESGYDDHALQALVQDVVELMKENPSIDRVDIQTTVPGPLATFALS